MNASPGSARDRIQHSRGTSDKARNERQKAILLAIVARQRDEKAARLCAQSGQLVAESKSRVARTRKQSGGA